MGSFHCPKEQRLYRAWLEDYEVNEHTHRQSATHTREAEGSYNYEPGSRQPVGEQESGKGGGKTAGKNKRVPKGKAEGSDSKPKKEKTEEQLARTALLFNITGMFYSHICLHMSCVG